MRKKYIFGKKLYISILTSILVLFTTVATTFAWVGVFANSTFEKLDITIKSSDLDEYGVEISLTGNEGTFSDTVNSDDLKKQILLNWGYSENQINSVGVNDLFNNLNMHQCTTLPNVSGDKIISMNDFYTMENTITHNYFKFDIYISATRYYEKGSSSDFLLDVYLKNGMVSGSVRNSTLVSPHTYPTGFHNPLVNLSQGIVPLDGGDEITFCRVNSKSATRIAFEKYEVVPKGNPSLYAGKSPISSIIYTGDSYDFPTYNKNDDIYEFGGILPDDINLSTAYFNNYEYKLSKNGIKHLNLPSSLYEIRGVESETKDRVLSSTTNHLIDSNVKQEKLSLDDMMKVTVYFWFEGWDADCFNVLNSAPTTLQITFSPKNDEVF